MYWNHRKWINRREYILTTDFRETRTRDSQIVAQWHKGTSTNTKVPGDNHPLQRIVQCPMTSLLAIYFNSKQHYSLLSSHFHWSLSVLDTVNFLFLSQPNIVCVTQTIPKNICLHNFSFAFHLFFGPQCRPLTHRNTDSRTHTQTCTTTHI